MIINNIVVVSPMYKEIRALIERSGIQKDFRYFPEDEVTDEDLVWADAFVSFKTKGTYDYSKVKWVHSLGAGVDSFLFKKAWNEEVLLTRTICSFGQRIAEYCLSYILKDLQFHDQFRHLNAEKKWKPITPKLLSEVKVLIYGTGEIGQRTAQLLSALGVDVYGVSLSGKAKHYFKEVCQVDSASSQLGNIDYLINTLPLTERTENLFNEELFKQVANIGFINVGRGASLNEQALLDAMEHKHVRFSVLDVFGQEPLPEKHPLWDQPNVFVTPHISAVTTPVEAVECFIETLEHVEQNQPLRNKVDVQKGF